MIFNLFRGDGRDRLEQIEAKVQTMLGHDRHAFDLSMKALLGELEAAEVTSEVHSIDRWVNLLEREIRRELLVRSSVFGGIDTPAVLIHMSIVKDIERVGDYAKNLLDLASHGANFSELDDAEEWRRLATEVSEYIGDAASAFRAYDAGQSKAVHVRGGALVRLFDDRVSALIRGDDERPQGIRRALAYRYLKRVVAHLMNMLTAVFAPLDRLDQFRSEPEDRAEDHG